MLLIQVSFLLCVLFKDIIDIVYRGSLSDFSNVFRGGVMSGNYGSGLTRFTENNNNGILSCNIDFDSDTTSSIIRARGFNTGYGNEQSRFNNFDNRRLIRNVASYGSGLTRASGCINGGVIYGDATDTNLSSKFAASNDRNSYNGVSTDGNSLPSIDSINTRFVSSNLPQLKNLLNNPKCQDLTQQLKLLVANKDNCVNEFEIALIAFIDDPIALAFGRNSTTTREYCSTQLTGIQTPTVSPTDLMSSSPKMVSADNMVIGCRSAQTVIADNMVIGCR